MHKGILEVDTTGGKSSFSVIVLMATNGKDVKVQQAQRNI